ncbi:arylamine N-acetyltransferase, partial [Actinomadura darangshiensis]
WVQRHTFAMNETFRIDFDVFNHYVSTSSRSPFTKRPFTQKFSSEALHVVDGTTHTITRPDGAVETRALAPEELPETLAGDFGIVLEDEDASALVEFVRALS